MPEITPELENAIADFWSHNKGGRVTNAVLVVEGMSDDGDMWLDFAWANGMRTWHMKGMLHEAIDTQTAWEAGNSAAEAISGEEGD